MNNEESTVIVMDKDESALSGADFEAPAEGKYLTALSNQVELITQSRADVFRVTCPTDFCTHNDKTAFLMVYGAERLARVFGFSWGKPEMHRFDKQDEKGAYYVWETDGVFKVVNPRLGLAFDLWAMGSCSSRNKLYGVSSEKDEKGKRLYKSLDEIDEQNVKRHSISSWIRAGVSQGLGLRQLPRDIFPPGWWDRIIHVKYLEGSGGGKPKAEGADKDLQQEISRWLSEITGGDLGEMKRHLRDASRFEKIDEKTKAKKVFEVEDVSRLTGKWLGFTHKKVKEMYDSFIGSTEGGRDGE